MKHFHRLWVIPTVLIFLLAACSSEEAPVSVEQTNETILTSDKEEAAGTVLIESVPIEPVPYERADALLDNIHSGGVPKDGIPSIDTPVYAKVADVYDDYDLKAQFFVLELEDAVYLYPQSILVWHEIVNLDEHGVAVTYCPLTGSCITYEYPEGLDTTFGTSGKLINSNLLMYDRATDVQISQIDGVGLENDLTGYTLNTIPTFWADWADVRDVYSDGLVLTDETGFFRDYNRDPYGSYTEEEGYNYYRNDGVIFPLMDVEQSATFVDKHVVIGIKEGDERLALNPSLVKDEDIYYFQVGDAKMVAAYDETIDVVRVFYHEGEETVSLESLLDNKTPNYFEVMWFAWYAFYPDTEVIK